MKYYNLDSWFVDLNIIVRTLKKKGYAVFKNPGGHDLNIVGIRTKDMTSNQFNDWLTVFYIFNRTWNFFAFPATTDPGIFYRQTLRTIFMFAV